MRRRLNRERLIADLVDAWNELPRRDKPDLMLKHPDIYSACSWLAAHETVKREASKR